MADLISQLLSYLPVYHYTEQRKSAMAIGKVNPLCFGLVFLFCFAVSSISGSDPDCVYTAYVRTGSILKAGTDSIITLTLYDADGYGVRINDLEAWGGLMGEGYDYFERGNLDIFSGRGPCLSSPICSMNLTSDGSGKNHGWYCNYVEVTVTGVHQACSQQLFTVEQWLATDTSPYTLTAIVDNCYSVRSRLAAGDGEKISSQIIAEI